MRHRATRAHNARRESASGAFYARRKSAGLGTLNDDDARSQRRSRRQCQHPCGQQGVFVCLAQDALLTRLRRSKTYGDIRGGFCLVLRCGDLSLWKTTNLRERQYLLELGRVAEQRGTALDLGTRLHTHGLTHKAAPYTKQARCQSTGPVCRCKSGAGMQSAVEDGSPGGHASSPAGGKEASSTSSGGEEPGYWS